MSQPFAEVSEPLARALTEKGFTELTPVQKAVWQSEGAQSDLRITSQTGSGKTVAVGLALGRELILRGPRASGGERAAEAIVLTPTRELAGQVERELSWLMRYVPDASVEVVTGGTSVLFEKKRLSRGPRIVVGTPGRMLDHLSSGALRGEGVRIVILDEADQMLDMGFRDELEGILDRVPGREVTHMLSATFAGEVLAVAQKYQKSPEHVEGSPLGAANRDIEHVAHVVPYRHAYDALINLLLIKQASHVEEPGRTLVFARTRESTLDIAARLESDGFGARPLSGDLSQAERTRTLSSFRTGRISILVATDVASRGLDVEGVDLVVHFDPPSDPDTFTHRSGRTGRAGRKGRSVLLIPPEARRRVERLLQVASVRPDFQPVPGPDKVSKAYQKLSRKRVFQSLEQDPDAEHLAYAEKLLEQKSGAQIIATLLKMTEVRPPATPRVVQSHFERERPPAGRFDRPMGHGHGPRRGPDFGGRGHGPPHGRGYGHGPAGDGPSPRTFDGPPRESGGGYRAPRAHDGPPRESGGGGYRGPRPLGGRPKGHPGDPPPEAGVSSGPPGFRGKKAGPPGPRLKRKDRLRG